MSVEDRKIEIKRLKLSKKTDIRLIRSISSLILLLIYKLFSNAIIETKLVV